MMTAAADPVSDSILYADPVAMALFDRAERAAAPSLGAFVHEPPPGLGFALNPATVAQAYTIVRGILGGSGDANSIKSIYQQMPQSLIRVTGGHGRWTDTLTGETMNDLQTEVRKVAVMASALGIYPDRRNWFFDDTTGQQLSPGAVLARWQKLFGPTTTFADAYARYPELFRVFGSDPSRDPVIRDIGGGPLAPSDRSGASLLGPGPGQIGTTGVSPDAQPQTEADAGRQPTGRAGVLDGVSPMLLLAGAAVILFMLGNRRR